MSGLGFKHDDDSTRRPRVWRSGRTDWRELVFSLAFFIAAVLLLLWSARVQP